MNTNLVLTRNSPLRTILVNDGTQQPLYSIETPRKIFRNTTRIRKLPPDTHMHQLEGSLLDSQETLTPPDADGETEGPDLPIENNEMARIHWHAFSSNRIVYDGRMMKRSDFLPKAGSGFTFTVRGMKLKWKLGFLGVSMPMLVLDDGSKTVIAQFHRQNNFINRRKAFLEIDPLGMEILDEIVLTFVFVEKKRRDREKRMRSSGGG